MDNFFRLPLAMRALVETAKFRASGGKLRLTGWFPIAQMEDLDELAPFPHAERLYPSRMRQIVATFNAAKYRPPVIRGTAGAVPGPAHYTGEYAEPSGYVVELDLDPVHLWGRAAEIIEPDGTPRMERDIAAGHLGRSIGFWVGDYFKMRHVALLTGEAEGQMEAGLPPLSSYFDSTLGRDEGARATAREYRVTRTLFPGSRVAISTPTPQEAHSMDEAAIRALLGEFSTATAAQLTEHLAPVTTQITGLRADLVTAQAEVTTLRQAVETSQRAGRESAIRTQLDGLVRAQRFSPAGVDLEVRTLLALPQDLADERLRTLATAEAVPASMRTVFAITGATGTAENVTISGDVDAMSARAAIETRAILADPKADSETTQRALESAGYRPAWAPQ